MTNSHLTPEFILKILLSAGALFFIFEFFLHFFGLPILEHDKIFLFTHDRYIGIFGLTYGALLILIATDIRKYKHLFIITMLGILLSMANAYYISRVGGYSKFSAQSLDRDLGTLGIGAVIWYALILIFWWRNK